MALVSAPPRHGKTEALLHGVAWGLAQRPELTFGYATYSADLARSKSRRARDLAGAADVVLREDSSALHEWRTYEGGGLLAAGVGGTWTGHGVNVFLIDDPHKNRADAESKKKRDGVHDWVTGTAFSRLEPDGSVIVFHHRWHPDDEIGRLAAEGGWEVYNLPAIADGTDPKRPVGTALWPGRWPLDKLEKRRRKVGPYDWESLYQGRPRPRGGSVFARDVEFYEKLPTTYRVVIALDLAYTAKTSSDWSVALVMAAADELMHNPETLVLELRTRYYVLDVVRLQLRCDSFAPKVAMLCRRFPGARLVWRAGGTELGVADLLRGEPHGLPLEVMPIQSETGGRDKFVLAQPAAGSWNRGDILLPHEGEWVPAFISEVRSFTGVNDAYDDQVDALATAHDALGEGVRTDDFQVITPSHY